MTERTHYEVLGVQANATAEEIKVAYRRIAQAAHPDRGGSDALFAIIHDAYRVLSDPVARAAYDRRLAAPPAPPAGRPTTFAEAAARGSRLFDEETSRHGTPPPSRRPRRDRNTPYTPSPLIDIGLGLVVVLWVSSVIVLAVDLPFSWAFAAAATTAIAAHFWSRHRHAAAPQLPTPIVTPFVTFGVALFVVLWVSSVVTNVADVPFPAAFAVTAAALVVAHVRSTRPARGRTTTRDVERRG
jgi:hypothetical protein